MIQEAQHVKSGFLWNGDADAGTARLDPDSSAAEKNQNSFLMELNSRNSAP